MSAGRWIVGRWSDLYGPPPDRDPPIHYVARCTKLGRIVPRSRLSEYFEGPEGREAAYAARDKLREAGTHDAGVFVAESREQAEAVLSQEAPNHCSASFKPV